MADCIFCRILRGEIPSQQVYEDEEVVAILDINPVAEGHALVLPRRHFETWTDLPADLAGNVARAAQTVARAVVRAVGAEGFNLLVNNRACSGQAIPHAHAHIIPRKEMDGVKFNWKTKPYEAGRIERIAGAIRSALEP
jgi:histidine triad (HIT) family protein